MLSRLREMFKFDPNVKPMAINKRVLIWLCMYPVDNPTNTRTKLFYVIFSFFIFASILSGFLSALTFFLKFVTINLEESLYAFFQVVACFSGIYMMIITILLLRSKMGEIFDEFFKIYDKCAGKIRFDILLD